MGLDGITIEEVCPVLKHRWAVIRVRLSPCTKQDAAEIFKITFLVAFDPNFRPSGV